MARFEPEQERPIYVSATKQHVGKTSVSLALVSGLQKRFGQLGFLKPVGQKSLPVWEEDQQRQLEVDKDVVLVKQHFGLNHLPWRYMSPVMIPPGYTKLYLDGKITNDTQSQQILEAHRFVKDKSRIVLCEGTGHCAVGSIVGAGNAEVASWLGADMVLVANGGLGSAFDELELNRSLCERHNVPVAGVIINKVQVDKYDQTKYYMEKALKERWDVPLLGCIPDRPYLGCPAVADLERLFEGDLLSGQEHRLRHYTVKDLNLVATSLQVFLANMREKPSRTLYVCHSSRDDILLGFLAECQRQKHLGRGDPEATLIICEGDRMDPRMLEMIEIDEAAPPILLVKQSTREVMDEIHSFTPKLNADDFNRVASTVNHYEPYIDFDLLLERTGNSLKEVGSKAM